MKLWSKIVLLLALIGAGGFSSELFASSGTVCSLQWNASPSPGIAGYALYYGVQGSSVTNRIDAGLGLSLTVTGLNLSTTYFFYVVVYDAYGDESPPSNVVLFTTPPISPLQINPASNGALSIQFQVSPGAACQVEYTPTLSPPAWTLLTTAIAGANGLVQITEPMNGSQGFFRAVIPAEIAPQVVATPSLEPTLQWNASPTPGTVGYTVYYGIAGSSVTNQINVGTALSFSLTDLLASTPYFFYVVSYNSSGAQSALSNPVLLTTPSMSPLQITESNDSVNIQFRAVPGTACQVQYTTTLDPPAWTALANLVADTNGIVSVSDPVNGPQRFYRGAIGAGILPLVQLPDPTLSYTLQWAADSDLGILGYVVNYAAPGSSVTNQVDVNNGLSTTISGLLPSTTYVFSISSLDLLDFQVVPFSAITYTTPPITPLEIGWGGDGAVLEFRVAPGAACHVEYTTSLNPPTWTVLTTCVADTNGLVKLTDPEGSSRSRFYRASVP